MNDEAPSAGNWLPPNQRYRKTYRVGEKCAVTVLSDGWICASSYDEIPTTSLRPIGHIIPTGLIGVDDDRSRIYFKKDVKSGKVVALVIAPFSLPFRPSKMGQKVGGSKIVDIHKDAVYQVILLYALKTNSKSDRLRALSTLPLEVWNKHLDFNFQDDGYSIQGLDVILREIEFLAHNDEKYRMFVNQFNREMVGDLTALKNWIAWQKIADKAVKLRRFQIEQYMGKSMPNYDTMLFFAVREVAIEGGGLPAQKNVRERWEKFGGQGEWDEIRDKLGFDWLPTLPEWKSDWKRLAEVIFDSK